MTRKTNLKTILFVHSAGPQYGPGKGSYDFVNYLRSQLSGEFKILFPKIEKPGLPTYAKYKKMLTSSFAKITGPVILIGHSVGSSTLLKYLSEEKPDLSISGLFLISTPHWQSDMKEFELKKDFQDSIQDIPIFLYHSVHDADAPFESLAFYKKAFKNATVRELPGKDHVFSKGLPVLVSDVKAL